MIYKTFDEIENAVKNEETKKVIALCGAQDSHSLDAVLQAKANGLCDCVLIGDREKIVSLLKERNEDPEDYKIIESEETACSKAAVELIHKGEADIPMKGLMQTSDFMRPILNKETGLIEPGNVLSQVTLVEYPEDDRFFLITDSAINIDPDLERKKQIIVNAVDMARKLGIEKPKVAAISALEVVNPKMPSTVDAAALAEMNRNGEIENCIVSGPLAFDNAINAEAAAHKGIDDPVAGHADVILVPEIVTGNVLTKSLIFFTQLKMAGTFLGTKCPIVACSRSDSAENKYRAILTGLFLGHQ